MYTLKSNVDSFQIVSFFATDKLIPKRTYNFSFQSNINSIFDPDEIKSLNKITNDNININYSLFRQQYEIEKHIDINMNFDVSRIYVFQNETDKIFVIKGIYYFMENNELKDVKDNDIINKFKYKDLIILDKITGGEDMAVFKRKPLFKEC